MNFEKISVCSDCLLYIANGELPPDTAPEEDSLITEGASRFPNLCAGGGAEGFSWQPCDCCRRPLGGDRFEAFYQAD